MVYNMKHFLPVTFLALAAAPAALAQKWEVGFGGGGSFMTSQTITNPIANADAGRNAAFALSAWLDNNSSSGLIGGELRYDYEHGDLKLSSGGTTTTFGSMSNAIHYDFVLNFTPKESAVRPYVLAGGGVKVYSGTGQEQALQPLGNIAAMADVRDVKALVSVGAGLKFKISPAAQFRVEVHDFLTPFPDKLILPVNGSKVGGWLSDFVIMAGLGFTF